MSGKFAPFRMACPACGMDNMHPARSGPLRWVALPRNYYCIRCGAHLDTGAPDALGKYVAGEATFALYGMSAFLGGALGAFAGLAVWGLAFSSDEARHACAIVGASIGAAFALRKAHASRRSGQMQYRNDKT